MKPNALMKLPSLLWLFLLSAVAQAQLTFTTKNGAITITGYNNAAGFNVVIPAAINGYPVTSIGGSAFTSSGITSVTIPNSVTNIGGGAFEYCPFLTSVTIPNSITSIGTYAFSGSGLSSVTIPNSVTSIGTYAFLSCTGLTSVTIPNSVTNIGDSAFLSCTGLTSVTIPNSVTNIGAWSFYGCTSLTSINVDAANPAYSSTNGVLFDKAQGTLLQFPGGLGGSYTIPNSVTRIGTNAFAYSGLTSVTIPNSVTSIGVQAFFSCTGLASVTIPNSVASLGDGAFAGCTSLTSITIPNSVTSLGDGDDGEGVFAGCASLTSTTIPNDLTNCAGAFAGSSLTNVTFASGTTSIVPSEFSGCTSLTSITIPNSVTSIGDYAFDNCTGLSSVTIPNSVTSLGFRAFSSCTSLTSVTILNSVTNIGAEAFYDCASLTSVTIPNSVTNLGIFAFYECTSLHQAYFEGNAPSVNGFPGSADTTVFEFDGAGTAYYVPGTTGWGSTFGGWPTAGWYQPQPQILGSGQGLGISSNGFNFTISWATNVSVIVEAATNLANPVWIPVSTNALANGANYFSDPQWTNYPSRFYRIVAQAASASAFTVGGTLTGLPAGDTITLQDNGGDNLTLSNNGSFTFPTALTNGQAYSVTVSGTSGGGSIQSAIYSPVTANGSGAISGANVANVAVQCTAVYTGNLDLDMYNAAVRDGTANGGVPAVMFTANGGPFRETAMGRYSYNMARIYASSCVFTTIVGTGSCSSTTFPAGTPVIQFGTVLECGFGPYRY